MRFKKVTYADLGDILARVNKDTGEVQLNKNIFDSLPAGFKNFVLLHEQGHYVLQTSDEFEANRYAISHFLPLHTETDEFGRRIVIMTQALTPGADGPFRKDPVYSNFDPISAIAGAIGGITQTLPSLGIGTKARINETNAMASAQIALAKESSKSSTNLILIGTGAIAVLMIIFLTVKSL
jgi:hypothetical protein